MSRRFLRFAPSRSCLGCFLLSAALSGQLLSQSLAPGDSSAASSTSPESIAHSDPAAIQAMQNVIAQSGGLSAWRVLRSADETFSVVAGDKTPHVIKLLDDWSSDTARYRRGLDGQTSAPIDHNGSSTFSLNTGKSKIPVPEFDQARTLVARLPAAAAETMIRRPEYVLKISTSQRCSSSYICVDVFRKTGSPSPTVPEQQWKILATTGLPSTVRYQTTLIGNASGQAWREVFYLKYAPVDGLTIPITIGMLSAGRPQTWTFVSLKQNPGFDTSKFDQGVTR